MEIKITDIGTNQSQHEYHSSRARSSCPCQSLPCRQHQWGCDREQGDGLCCCDLCVHRESPQVCLGCHSTGRWSCGGKNLPLCLGCTAQGGEFRAGCSTGAGHLHRRGLLITMLITLLTLLITSIKLGLYRNRQCCQFTPGGAAAAVRQGFPADFCASPATLRAAPASQGFVSLSTSVRSGPLRVSLLM